MKHLTICLIVFCSMAYFTSFGQERRVGDVSQKVLVFCAQYVDSFAAKGCDVSQIFKDLNGRKIFYRSFDVEPQLEFFENDKAFFRRLSSGKTGSPIVMSQDYVTRKYLFYHVDSLESKTIPNDSFSITITISKPVHRDNRYIVEASVALNLVWWKVYVQRILCVFDDKSRLIDYSLSCGIT